MNTIKITDSIDIVIVPKDCDNYHIKDGELIYRHQKRWVYSGIKNVSKVHGFAKLTEVEFDFMYTIGSYDTMILKSRIQKAIKDEGFDIKDKNLLIIEKIK